MSIPTYICPFLFCQGFSGNYESALLQTAKPKKYSCSYCCKSVDFRATPPECNDSLRESKTEDNLSYWSQQIKLSKVRWNFFIKTRKGDSKKRFKKIKEIQFWSTFSMLKPSLFAHKYHIKT